MTWTERFETFTPTQSASWTDYDIYTNLSVPKGAVAVIAVNLIGTGWSQAVGVRTDSSSIERSFLNPAYDYIFNVVVDVNTGLIEIKNTSSANFAFYLLGYWEDVTYVEKKDSITVTTGGWRDYDIYTNLSVPKGAICDLLAYGARKDGSAIDRRGTVCTKYAVVDSSTGMVELYATITANQPILLGYFTSGVSYTEEYTAITLSSATGWIESATVSKMGVQDIFMYGAASVALGTREYSSALSRYITPTSGYSVGLSFPVQSSDTYYFYKSTTAVPTVYRLGVFYQNYEHKQSVIIGI